MMMCDEQRESLRTHVFFFLQHLCSPAMQILESPELDDGKNQLVIDSLVSDDSDLEETSIHNAQPDSFP